MSWIAILNRLMDSEVVFVAQYSWKKLKKLKSSYVEVMYEIGLS
jgi:hypothetical protein